MNYPLKLLNYRLLESFTYLAMLVLQPCHSHITHGMKEEHESLFCIIPVLTNATFITFMWSITIKYFLSWSHGEIGEVKMWKWQLGENSVCINWSTCWNVQQQCHQWIEWIWFWLDKICLWYTYLIEMIKSIRIRQECYMVFLGKNPNNNNYRMKCLHKNKTKSPSMLNA